MPDTTAHHYFGQEVLKRLPTGLAGFVRREKTAFDLGLQGPDLLYYYKPLKPNEVSGLGVRLHCTDAHPAMRDAVHAIRESPDNAALGYLLGYSCHFVLDSSIHSRIARVAPDITDHFRLEAEIDRQIILLHYSSRPQAFKRHALVRAGMHTYGWLQKIYPQVSTQHLEKSVKSMAFYLKLLRSRRGYKKKLLVLAENMLGKRGYFTGMMVNRDKCEEFYESAKALCVMIEDLCPTGVLAVKNVYASVTADTPLSELFNRNFG